MTTFAEFGLTEAVVAALERRGIVEPFGIQAATLPDSLAGRDVLGRGPTGSGKTVAFLARAADLRSMTIYGGVGYAGQLKRLAAGVDIVIATPGRLEDLLAQGSIDLSEVLVTVLDEADLMADMGFLPPVRRLLDLTPPGQRLLFSATLDGDVDRLVRDYLHNPVTHAVEPGRQELADHFVFLVTRENRARVLTELVAGHGRSLVFARTKHGAARIAQQLTEAGVPADELHGDLAQGARQRNLKRFTDGSVRVLVATDVAARGIHVDEIALVVHADPPAEAKSFLHRSGRTARAGASGSVVTLCQRDQNKRVKALLAAAGVNNPRREVVEPGSDLIAELRGEWAPPPVPAPERAHFERKRGATRARVDPTKGRRRDRPPSKSTGSRRPR